MSDISDFMDFSPTRQSKVAACEKFRDTVHCISAMHSSMLEGARTPSPKNSFLELYQMSTYDLAKKKDECQSRGYSLTASTNDIARSNPFQLRLRHLQWTSFSFLAAILTEPRTIHLVADSFTNQEHSFQSLETVLDPSAIISDTYIPMLLPYHHSPFLNYF
ncbi:hypothetical protein TNCV_4790721 [Trichonephila clavipes]|nr:hypothetical protein TNCV_4790721 [Trichonephila clavipes]